MSGTRSIGSYIDNGTISLAKIIFNNASTLTKYLRDDLTW
jgi:hypothetical protein